MREMDPLPPTLSQVGEALAPMLYAIQKQSNTVLEERKRLPRSTLSSVGLIPLLSF